MDSEAAEPLVDRLSTLDRLPPFQGALAKTSPELVYSSAQQGK
jgi:hypothetical protein